MSLRIARYRWTALVGLLTVLALGGPAISEPEGARLISQAKQDELLKDSGVQAAGAVDANVTIVEYFDYNCPFCRKLAPDLKSLIAEDHKVAILYKDWPVFGGVSVYAAKEALAASWQGKYLLAHDALISGPRLTTPDQVDAELKAAGIDVRRLAEDRASHVGQIEALLARNDAEAHTLSIRGTPGIVIGRQVLPGSADLNGLRAAVKAARSAR